jgi:hypothetical protein
MFNPYHNLSRVRLRASVFNGQNILADLLKINVDPSHYSINARATPFRDIPPTAESSAVTVLYLQLLPPSTDLDLSM